MKNSSVNKYVLSILLLAVILVCGCGSEAVKDENNTAYEVVDDQGTVSFWACCRKRNW